MQNKNFPLEIFFGGGGGGGGKNIYSTEENKMETQSVVSC